ncbi:MAG: ATP-binding cassette domain-containing protein [Actinobacteria bacterium]|nr:ATP-binding cassette domain-containing protein [Actinomycetota bacterium]
MPSADISLRRVSRTYALGDEEISALSDVSLDIAQGEFVAVRGPSGSGKSTLANVIGGLDRHRAHHADWRRCRCHPGTPCSTAGSRRSVAVRVGGRESSATRFTYGANNAVCSATSCPLQ